jgi:uncharacterized protein (DUF433 family)
MALNSRRDFTQNILTSKFWTIFSPAIDPVIFVDAADVATTVAASMKSLDALFAANAEPLSIAVNHYTVGTTERIAVAIEFVNPRDLRLFITTAGATTISSSTPYGLYFLTGAVRGTGWVTTAGAPFNAGNGADAVYSTLTGFGGDAYTSAVAVKAAMDASTFTLAGAPVTNRTTTLYVQDGTGLLPSGGGYHSVVTINTEYQSAITQITTQNKTPVQVVTALPNLFPYYDTIDKMYQQFQVSNAVTYAAAGHTVQEILTAYPNLYEYHDQLEKISARSKLNTVLGLLATTNVNTVINSYPEYALSYESLEAIQKQLRSPAVVTRLATETPLQVLATYPEFLDELYGGYVEPAATVPVAEPDYTLPLTAIAAGDTVREVCTAYPWCTPHARDLAIVKRDRDIPMAMDLIYPPDPAPTTITMADPDTYYEETYAANTAPVKQSLLWGGNYPETQILSGIIKNIPTMLPFLKDIKHITTEKDLHTTKAMIDQGKSTWDICTLMPNQVQYAGQVKNAVTANGLKAVGTQILASQNKSKTLLETFGYPPNGFGDLGPVDLTVEVLQTLAGTAVDMIPFGSNIVKFMRETTKPLAQQVLSKDGPEKASTYFPSAKFTMGGSIGGASFGVSAKAIERVKNGESIESIVADTPILLPDIEKLRTFAKIVRAGAVANSTAEQSELLALYPEFYDQFTNTKTTTVGDSMVPALTLPSVASTDVQAATTSILQGQNPLNVVRDNPKLLPYTSALMKLSKFAKQKRY